MLPGSLNIEIYQGDTYEMFLRLRVVNPDGSVGAYMDLTGWTGRSQIRPNESSAVILGTFTVTIADQVAVPGGVLLDMAPADTSLLPVTGGKYDVELTAPDGTVRTYLKGDVTVLPEVTR